MTLDEYTEILGWFKDNIAVEKCAYLGGLWQQIDWGLVEPHGEFSDYRKKPEPKRVPLGPDDIPPVCWLMGTAGNSLLVVTVTDTYLGFANGASAVMFLEYQTLMDLWLYSSDRKDWKPCYKEVIE